MKKPAQQDPLYIKEVKGGIVGDEVTLNGWVRTARKQKTASFLVVNDGSDMEGIQCVFPNNANFKGK